MKSYAGANGGKTVGCTLALVAILLLGWHSTAPGAQFGSPGVTNGVVTLTLQGNSGVEYRLESSTNLSVWIQVATRVSTGQALVFQDPVNASGSRFYRAVQVSSPPTGPSYAQVTPSANPNQVATAMVAPDIAAALRLQTVDGIDYSLVLPTNAVSEAVIVQMTALTNVVNSGGSEGFLAGVRIEPDDVVLASPAFLEITLPPGRSLPAQQIASYSFQSDGSLQHLVPDLVQTNRVRILVNVLRSYATGAFTPAEFAALSTTTPPPTGAARPVLQASLEECYPNEKADVKKLHQHLVDAARPHEQAIAKVLGEARQRALLGVEEVSNPVWAATVQQEMAAFYAEELAPRVKAGPASCGEGGEITRWVLGLERQRQLLGAQDADGGMSADAMAYACKAMAKCASEALNCCQTHGPDTRVWISVLGMERQAQLLGMAEGDASCGSADRAAALDACLPDWVGTLTVSDSYSRIYSHAYGVFSSKASDRTSFGFQGNVANVKVTDLVLTKQLDFEIVGVAVGGGNSSSSFRDVVACDCPPTPGGAKLESRAHPLDGCAGKVSDWSEDQGSLTNTVSVKVTYRLPGDLVIPGFDPTEMIRLQNESASRGLGVSQVVPMTGMRSHQSECPEDKTTGIRPLRESLSLPASAGSAKIIQESYSKDAFILEKTYDKVDTTEDETREYHFRLRLELRPKQR